MRQNKLQSRFLALLLALFISAPALANELPKTECLRTHFSKPTSKKRNYLTLQLEIAATMETRERGLMGRGEIGACDGMTFWFPKIAIQKFWMKNTQIPLDILFIDRGGTIVQISQGKPFSEEAIGPDSPIASVIELASGRVIKEGIKVGDRVHYEIETETKNLAR